MQIGRTSCSNFFGEHVPRTADSGGVCADARDATALVFDPPRPGASLDFARTFSKLGAQVIVTVRRIMLHLPQAFRT